MNTNENRFSLFSSLFASRNRRSLRPNVRRLAAEQLEERTLLSVSPADYDAIAAAYPDFSLPASQEDINILEVDLTSGTDASANLANLKTAIATAKTTTAPDLIVVRTSETANTITYAAAADEITIDIDATQYGSISLVGWGDENLTLDANQLCRVMTVSGYNTVVNLGGITITGGNTTSNGGGISNSGALTVTNSTISGNTAKYSGGGIFNEGDLTVTNSTISGNTAEVNGGGIYNNSGALTVTNSTISENTAEDNGGGILNYEGVLTVTNSTISGNTAEDNGGGILNYEGALTVTNSTISGNTAEDNGGGIYNGGALTVTNSTISGNTAEDSGGGIDNNGTLELYNSFVSLNYSENRATNIYGTYSGDNNLIGCHPMFVCDPVFSNGVLTNADSLDFHLRSDSPAIDAGDNSKITAGMTDLNGNARNYGETVDIGAYEYQGDRNDEPIPYSSVVNTLNDSFDLNDEEWSLREAIYWATQYTEITFAEGLEGTITLASGQLIVDKALSIDGVGKITIDASQNSRVMRVEAGTEEQPVILSGLTITGGMTDDNGGGIYNYGDNALTITNLTISGNTASDYYSAGGGIYNYNGTIKVTNSTISGNTADNGGGIYNYHGALTVTNSTISGNTADDGGGIYNNYYGALTVTNSTISGNTADYDGGGICNIGDNALTITNSTISGNTADYNGGGIFNYHSALTVTNSTISGNTAAVNGGGIYNDYGDLTVTNSTISGNTASGTNSNGGGIYNNSDALTVNKSIVAMNYASSGYANVYGTLTDTSANNCIDYNPLFVCRPVFDDTGALNNANEADYHLLPYSPWANRLQEGYIGAYEYEGEPTVAPKDFSIVTTLTDEFDLTNDVISLREAIWYVSDEDTTITFAESLFGEENSITLALDSQLQTDKPMAIDGAGRVTIDGQNKTRLFYNTSSLILTRLTISNGKANDDGGGIYNDDGDLTITNSTISGNSADGNGGGIYNNNDDGDLTVTNSTISGNTASGTNSNGGGVYNKSGTFTAYNTIVACNTADNKGNDIDYYRGTVKGYNSLSSYTSWNGMDCIEYDAEKPLFRSISNGDYRLANGSQAINKGNNEYAVDASGNLLEFDQTGNARIKFDVVDIGAYECQEIVVNTLEDVVDADDGKWSLREALSTTPDLAVITFHESLAGGTITLSGTELCIDESLIIDASALEVGITINADQKSGVFRINVRTDDAPVQLIGLNITGGNSRYGGIYNSGALTVTNSTISGNTADYGGGIYNYSGDLTVTNSTISGNTAADNGGGICNDYGALTVTNSTISGNTADNGGGIFNGGELTVTNSTISDNITSDASFYAAGGGGICNSSGTLTIIKSTISGNTAYYYGGGIYDYYGDLTVTNSTISGNSAKNDGGGIYKDNNGDLTITNSTISGNSTENDGGGIYSSAWLTVTNSTISGNSAKNDGGGIYYWYKTLTLYNSIVSLNYSENGRINVSGTYYGDNNLIDCNPMFVSAPVFSNGVLVNEDSLDFHLRSDSDAIDAGDNRKLTEEMTDLNGNERVYGETVDIGAYEYLGGRTDEPFYSSVVDTLNDSFDLNDGEWSLREAIYWATQYTEITFAEGLEGTITLVRGQLIVDKALSIDGAGKITIDANQNSRVMLVEAGTEEQPVVLSGLTITGGQTDGNGAGIYNYEGALTVTNCTISGNTASGTESCGGGIYSSIGLTVTNSTISGNVASNKGGGVFNNYETFDAYNTIIACNTATVANTADIYNNSGTVNGYNSLSSYAVWGKVNNNIIYDSAKPLFRNIENGDYRLAIGSQAINKGNNDYAVDAAGNLLVLDQTGNARIMFETVDIGAYEYQGIVVDTLDDVVDPNDGKWSLRELISQAPASGTITFDESLAGGTITLSGEELVVDKSLVIDASALTGGITINADQKSRVFNIAAGTAEAPVQLIGLNITGGTTEDYGGGIYNGSSCVLTVTNSTISGNTAVYYGGGICNYGALTVTNSTISGNTAVYDGGGICNYGALTVTNSTISGNTAENGGGICSEDDALTVTNSTITGNTAEYGGGICNYEGALTVTNSIVAQNYASDLHNDICGTLSETSGHNIVGYNPVFAVAPVFDINGTLTNAQTLDLRLTAGSRAINAGSSDVTLTEFDLDGNPRVVGNGVDIGAYEFQGTPATEPTTFSTVVNTLEDSFVADDAEWSLREALYWTTGPGTITFDDSIAGGTISLNRRLSVYGMSIDGGLSGITLDAQQKGRAMETTGTVTLIGLTITGGKTDDYGAGICNCDDGDLTVTNCTISGNTATGNYSNGAGIHNFGALTVTNSTISDNTASGTKSSGGGICNEYGDLTVTNSTISGNMAESNGGGIYNYYGWLTVTNSTISENTASNGGGINNSGMIDNNYGGFYDRGVLTVTNSTISGNTASGTESNGGGIYNDGGTLTANNSIITETIYLDSGVIKGSNNLSSYTEWSSGSNNFDYDPDQALFEDAAYGDYRILPGSQAHNAGNNDLALAAGLTLDSKDRAGMPRFTDGLIDIGAYECYTVSPMVLNEEIAGNLTAENQYMQGYSFAVDDETTISFSLLQGDWNELFVILYGPDYSLFLTSESGKFTLSEAGTYYLQLQPAVESTVQAYEFCVNFHDVEILSIGVADSSSHATTDVIPDGLTELTDWNSFYVEFWSESMPEASANQSATAAINYDPTLFTLDKTQTIVCPAGISAVFSESKTEDDGTITVEVTFTIGAEDYTAPGANLYWGCVHFTPTLTEGAGLPDIYSKADSFGAKVKAVAYDLERNDKIDMTDFIEFAKLFNQKVEGNENPLVAIADFNGSGTVDMNDFILFAMNFNRKKSDAIVIPKPNEPAAAAIPAPVTVAACPEPVVQIVSEIPIPDAIAESAAIESAAIESASEIKTALPNKPQRAAASLILGTAELTRQAADEAILNLYENQYAAESVLAVQPKSLDEESDIDETTAPAAPNTSSSLEVNRIDSFFTDLETLDWE